MAAKMKHARHSGSPSPRPAPPPKPPRPLGSRRGQQAFREQLAREYGVEQPPKAFQQRFEQTLLQLPDQVPVRPRPVYYLLRRTAAAAAAWNLQWHVKIWGFCMSGRRMAAADSLMSM